MRHCEVDRLEIDLPCDAKAYGYLKISSKEWGDKTKDKLYLCKRHYELIDEEGTLSMIFSRYLGEPDSEEFQSSPKYRARLNKI
jgi:hypothetical protein